MRSKSYFWQNNDKKNIENPDLQSFDVCLFIEQEMKDQNKWELSVWV